MIIEKTEDFILGIFVFLLPIFFIPNLAFGVGVSKFLLVVLATVILAILWSIRSLKKGKIFFRHSLLILLSLLLLVVSYVVSSLTSSNPGVSFFGLGFEFNTTFSIIVLAFLSFFSGNILSRKRRIFWPLLALLLSFIVLFVYHSLRVFLGADFLSFDIFTNLVSTPVGGWYNFSLLSGLVAIISLIALESSLFSRAERIIATLVLLFSLISLAVTGFDLAWILLSVSSLVVFAISLVMRRSEEVQEGDDVYNETDKESSIPVASLIVFIISLGFIFFGGFISDYLSTQTNLSYIEVRPSFDTTVDIGREVLEDETLLFGMGPSNFSKAWDLHKPIDVNETIFWNADFDRGASSFLTEAVNTGAVGVVAWAILFALIIFASIRMIGSFTGDGDDPVTLSYILGTLYLLAIFTFYVPSGAMFTLFFVFVGGLGALFSIKSNPDFYFIDIRKGSLRTLLSIAIVVLVLAGALWVSIQSTRQTSASVYYNKSLLSLGQGEFEESGNLLARAINIYPTDNYLRSAADFVVTDLDRMIQESQGDLSAEVFASSGGNAISFAREAVSADSQDVKNWITLSAVYEYLASFGVEGSVEVSREGYIEARKRDPNTPIIDLALARIEVLSGDTTSARSFVEASLAKKSNYTPALVFLSNLQIEEGDREGALRTLSQAALSSSGDPSVYYRLGVLSLNEGRIDQAVFALERAVISNPVFANAKYFLGLAYVEQGRIGDARAQFEDVLKLNPGNQLVLNTLDELDSLEAGGDEEELGDDGQ